MSSVEQDDSAGAENGGVTRRTRSGRPSRSPAPAATPKSTRSKKPTQKPIFEETQTLQEMSAGLDNFFAQEGIEDQEDFDMPASDGSEQHIKNDSPNANISRALDEGSNGSMDGMLKTCFEDGVSGEPIEPMDVSITEDSIANVESEDETNDKGISSDKEGHSSDKEAASSDKEAASSDKEPASSDVEEVAEETSDDVEAVEEDRAVVEEPMSDDVVENAVEDIIEDAIKDVVEVAVEGTVEGAVEDVAEEAVENAVKDADEVVPQVVQEPAPEVVDETTNATEEKEQQEKEITTITSTDDEKSSESKKDQEMDEGEKPERTRDDETEVVSEDELPGVEKPEVKDAENVSDDELPGPKPADLPADTEVVSEDELPSSKKEQSSRKRKAGSTAESGYDPGSPTSEGETTAKKQAVLKDGESKPQASDKKSAEEKPAKKKTLPELDKYWKAVNDDATDFTGWTYLLQYVDQESDVEAAREAYDAFLSHYPYCYGYWRKYADYEKRKGSKKKCLEVLERGLRGIPLSVDLWIHYLNHVKTTRADEHDHIRQQYERAIAACGLEFRSDRLWESFIKWETENGTPLKVTALYDKLLMTPTLGYTSHFDNFQEHILANAPHACITTEEFLRLRGEVRAEQKSDPPLDSDPDIPPGEEEADDHVRSEEEGTAIKERIVSLRRKVHKMTVEQVAQRWNFEEGIKRPYFHVKPLERCQLKNWKAYLQWEEQQHEQQRTLVLYERCLIACALYEDFWLRLVQYLERCTAAETEDTERQALIARTRDVLERACTIHHVERPALHVHWAAFEERQGSPAKAADILEKLEKVCPNLLQVACRRINLERRRGDLDRCTQLYEQYIAQYSKQLASSMTVKYARFLQRVKRDPAAAVETLRAQAARDPTCQRLYLQMMDIKLCSEENNLKDAVGYIDEYLAVEGIDNESRLLFMQRKAELLEELGDDLAEGQAALLAYQALSKQQHKKKNKEKNSSSDNNSGSKKKSNDTTVAPPLPPSTPNTGANTPGGYGNAYGASQGQGGQAPTQQQQPQYEGGPGYPQQPYHQWGPTYHHPSQYHHNPWNPYPNYY